MNFTYPNDSVCPHRTTAMAVEVVVAVGRAVARSVVVAVVRAVAGAERRVQQSIKGWQRLQMRQWQPWQR